MTITTFRADLHTHTSCSDGSYSPQELVAHAKKLNLSGLCITDHDTFSAYETAVPAAKEANLLLGSGIELSCHFKSMSVHILGYDYDLSSPYMALFCKRHQDRRFKRNQTILDNLARRNMPIKAEDLSTARRTIGRPHIAMAMVEKGYVSSVKMAFDLYLGEGKCCYAPGELFSVEESIDVIHNSGGKAFLAHPHLIDQRKLLKDLLLLKFDGIECYYAKCTVGQEKPWLKIAKEKGWLISGGSDFHGDFKPHIPLGCSWVDEETFKRIFQRSL